MKVLEVLNLGAGVQSTAVLLMSAIGALPKLDAAIFADTCWEPKAVYEHLKWLTAVAADVGIPVHTVSAGNIRKTALARSKGDRGRWASMPLFVKPHDGEGREGMLWRQCTREYKIEPIERFIRRDLLGLKPKQAAKAGVVCQWFGISVDEPNRIKPSRAKWKTHYYPLTEIGFSRSHCLGWMDARGYPLPPRSACIGCPYRSNTEWRWLREHDPEGFADACAFDDEIRNFDPIKGTAYLHRSLIPLKDVDLSNDVDHGQVLFGWARECEGMCGV